MSLLWDFFNHHIVVFFETSILKEVRILRYLHNNSAVLILMLSYKIKLSHTILIHTWKTFVADFFYDKVFHTLYFFNSSTLFFIKLFFFFWKTQNTSESMFYKYCRTFINSFFIYKRLIFYIKWEQNYISKLQSMMTHILMSWFKESTERQKN